MPIGEDVGAGLRTSASYEEHDFRDSNMFARQNKHDDYNFGDQKPEPDGEREDIQA